MRAAFSYYIHRPWTAAAGKSSPAFPIGRMRLSRLGFSWVKTRGPASDRSSRRFSRPRSPSSRPIEASVHPGLSAHLWEVPSRRWPSVLAQTRRLRPQKPRRARLGLLVAAILPAIPRSPPPGDVLEALAGASPWTRPWRAGGRWSRGGRAQKPPLSRRIVGRVSVAAESPRGLVDGCREGSGS